MDLVGADADFRAQPILEAIGKAGRSIYHHAAGVHLAQKTPGLAVVFGQDGVGVVGSHTG